MNSRPPPKPLPFVTPDVGTRASLWVGQDGDHFLWIEGVGVLNIGKYCEQFDPEAVGKQLTVARYWAFPEDKVWEIELHWPHRNHTRATNIALRSRPSNL